MKKFRFLISTTFAILSVALLMDERKETTSTDHTQLTAEVFGGQRTNGSERLLFTKSIISKWNKTEEGVFDANFEIIFCPPLKKIFGSKSELNLDQIVTDLVEFFNRTFMLPNSP